MKNLYSKTIQLIYSQASERIDKKYKEWARSQSKRSAKIDVYSDTKLLNNVLNYHVTPKIRQGNYSKLVSLDLAKALVANLDFKDLNEVYWGDPKIYFKDFFETLLLEIPRINNYTGYFRNMSLSTKKDIEKFYQNYKDEILIDGERSQSLLSRFIDFTYNVNERMEPTGDVFKNKEVKIDKSNLKNVSSETLTFENLPDSLHVFSKDILLPFIYGIEYNDFVDSLE